MAIVYRPFISFIFKFIVVDEEKKTEICRKPVSFEFNVCIVETAKGDFQKVLKWVGTSSFHEILISSVVKQKCKSDTKRVIQEKKAREIFRKTNIFYPLIHIRACVYRVKKCLYFEKFGVFGFLVIPALRFILLPCCGRFINESSFPAMRCVSFTLE